MNCSVFDCGLKKLSSWNQMGNLPKRGIRAPRPSLPVAYNGTDYHSNETAAVKNSPLLIQRLYKDLVYICHP